MLLPPVWFYDIQAAPVRTLLRWFVLQLNQKGETERSRPLVRKLNPKNIPPLFDYSAPDEIDFLWEAIMQLAAPPYEIWNESRMRSLRLCIPDQQPSVVFNYSAEIVVRNWLNMPRIEPGQQAWLDTLDSGEYTNLFDIPRLREAGYPGVYPPEKIMQALVKLNSSLDRAEIESLSWRRLSARFFFGDSKYLDSASRQGWLGFIFPQLTTILKARALLLSVHLVSQPKGILIIENLDTFCWLREEGVNLPGVRNLHLVYGQGFTGSAQRVRDAAVIRFNIDGDIDERRAFENNWFKIDAITDMPYYFWGDLDFSGIAILKALRHQFPDLMAWQPGYRPMLTALEQGIGHTALQAGKTGQLVPDSSGCPYADQYLLPALICSGLFLDQEWVSLDSLRE